MACGAHYPVHNAIPSLIVPERRDAAAIFCQKYDALRLKEGWASDRPGYYENIPFRDLTGGHSQEWYYRLTSLRFLQQWLARNFGSTRLRIVDVGAGTGWMSRGLSANHDVMAVDVNAGPHGLAALPESARRFKAVQAELDRLPLADDSFDLAVANASLHHADNVEAVLEKISRLLRPAGELIVMDSPTYATRAAAHTAHERTRAYYSQAGVAELADHYHGLTSSDFQQNKDFTFRCLRRDFSRMQSLKKWLYEMKGGPASARFPIWLGQRRVVTNEESARSMQCASKTLFCSVLVTAAIILTGCKDLGTTVDAVLPPELVSSSISSLPDNLAGGQITLHTRHALSAAVAVRQNEHSVLATPFFTHNADSVIIPLLGLPPSKNYRLTVFLTSTTGSIVESGTVDYTTPPLVSSSAIPPVIVTLADSPTVRFVMLGISPARNGQSVAMIIDRSGSPVWVRLFSDAVVDFQLQPAGKLTAWTSSELGISCFQEMDLTGRLLRTYSAEALEGTAPHELRMISDGYVLFGIEFRTMDLTPFNGHPAARIRGTLIEMHKGGAGTWRWDPFEHFSVADAASDVLLTESNVNPWHGNAIDIDSDGNLLVSFRNSDEITKISTHNGQILWRLGGKKNQFSFVNDRFNGFSHQHGVRRLSNGNVLMFDNGNGHSPQVSRAVEYRLDETRKIAELVWEYSPNPPLYGYALGFAQRLANGHTLICFGTSSTIIEVDQAGRKRWEAIINEQNRYAYRAISIDSLY